MSNELYRSEVVIDVNDESAVRRIKRAEDRLNETLNRMQKQGRAMSKLEIKPLMSVRDDLSKKVASSEKLIKKLGDKKAAPVIEAQDKVTNVTKKISSALEKIDKGDFSAAVEMKGDIMSEIDKAEKALKALDKVESAPVSKMKGDLFESLQRAKTELALLDRMNAKPRTSLLDRVTSRVREITSSVRRMAQRPYDVVVRVRDEATRVLGRIKSTLTSLPAMLGLGAMTLGPAALIGGALGTAADFELGMAKVQAITGADAAIMQQMQEQALDLGKQTKYSPTEIAGGMRYLGMAGWDDSQIQAAMPNMLNLAMATDADIGSVADISSDVMTAFGLGADKFGQFSDAMAKVTTTANTDIYQLGDSMKYAAPIAREFGMSFEETAAIAGKMADGGIKGSQAGTALRSALTRLAKPPKEAADALKKLDVATTDSSGNMRNIIDIIGDMEKGMDGLSESERLAAASSIFGQEAASGWLQALGTGSASLSDYVDSLENAGGTTEEMAEIMKNTFKGSMDAMKSAWDTFLIRVGGNDGLGPAFRRIVDSVSENLGRLEEFFMENSESIAAYAETMADKLTSAFDSFMDLLNDPDFQSLSLTDKILFVLDSMLDSLNEWASGEGGKKVESIFIKLAEIAISAWMKALGGLAKASFNSLMEGNLGAAGGLALGAGALGGGLVVRGAIGAGKAVVGAGKGVKKGIDWMTGKGKQPTNPPLPVTKTPPVSPASPPTNGGARGFLGKAGDMLSKGGSGVSRIAGRAFMPLMATMEIASAFKSPSEERSAAVGRATGAIGGGLAGAKTGALAGAAIGSVVPGVGTAIGGAAGSIVGGIAGSIGGSALGEKIGDWFKGIDFSGIGDWFKSIDFSGVKEGFNSAVDSVSESFSSVVGSISDTLFSKQWWSGKWDDVRNWSSEKLQPFTDTFNSVKDTVNETLFSGDWWSGKWDSVKTFATNSFLSGNWWAEQIGFVVGVLEGTLFSGEWWSGKWQGVKDWTSEKWNSFIDIWTPAVELINSTLFSGEWWSEKWQNVKDWTSEKWNSFIDIWTPAVELINSTLFSGEWWSGKWQGVKDWTSEKWNSFTDIWDAAVESINSTVFSGEWWSGKWQGVKDWTSEKWDTFSSVWESARSAIESSLFSKEWWSGKWGTVKGWASSAWEGIKGMASDLGSSFNKGRSSGNQAVAYANGGIISRPHLGLVGEAGPEAIIPLSSGRRARAIDLWEKTGQMLGVSAYANGGIVGGGLERPINLYQAYENYQAPTGTDGGSSSYVGSVGADGQLVVDVGGVEVTVNVGEKIDYEKIAEECGWRIANAVRKALENR